MSSEELMFVTVSFRQPLEEPMSGAEANNRIDWMEESVAAGRREFVAFAEGHRRLGNGEMVEVMLFLIYDHDEACYVVYENGRTSSRRRFCWTVMSNTITGCYPLNRRWHSGSGGSWQGTNRSPDHTASATA